MRDIESNVRRFDQDRAAAAHWIEQRNAGRPTSKTNNSGGEIFPERCFTRGNALAAFEEGLTRGIEIKRKLAITQMTLDRNIGFSRIDVRAPSRDPANLIAHRVFDFQRDEIEARQRTLGRGDIDAKGPRRIEPISPARRVSGAINVLLATVITARHLPKNAAGDAAFKIDSVAKEKSATELDTAADGVNFFRFKLAQFSRKKQLQTSWTRGKKSFHEKFAR